MKKQSLPKGPMVGAWIFSGSRFLDLGSYFLRLSLIFLTLLLGMFHTFGNPLGGSVAQGSATFSTVGSQLTIHSSDRSYINWQSFNIGVGETTTFIQPSSSSLIWNNIHDANPSQILGNLNANGYIVLQNQAGFFIGGQAAVSAHALVMTTAPIPMPDLTSGGAWSFNAPPPTASIINYGQISADSGGSVFLIARDIQNNGSITAPQGSIGLYAGKEVLVSERPDGRGLSATVTLPEGSVDNNGRVVADAGTIAMHAQVVNQGGLVQANSVVSANGVIELVASDSLNLGPASVVSAQDDPTSPTPSQGGFVVVKSGKTFTDTATSAINVSGKAGGRDGVVEVFGDGVTSSTAQSQIDGQSAAGFSGAGGLLLVNPQDLTLSSAPSAVSSSTPNLNLSDLSSFSKIDLLAAGNINLNSGWSLPDSQDNMATLTLSAGNSVSLADGSGLGAGAKWAVNVVAGPRGLSSKPSSSDGIYLNGNSYIQTQDGSVNLWAANEVMVNAALSSAGNNGIRTLGGGSIDVTAEYGGVNTGGNRQGFTYLQTAPFQKVSPFLGGISTGAGGDVTISAGGDVTSYLPNSTGGNSSSADPGAGVFGLEPGNVTINAGGSVFGHYVVANGVGTITACRNIGGPSASKNVALSLISGAWTLNAPNGDIYLQEVRNPNGVFDALLGTRGPAAGNHLFNYDPHASVELDAGVGVYLTGSSIPRPAGAVPVLYPPTLDITAGSEGVVLSDNVTLFPSAYGELHISTAGDFANDPNSGNPHPTLLMSDSSQTRWSSAGSFGQNDHTTGTPIEVGNLNPVLINVSGNMHDITLITSKETRITVGGNMENCSFQGENLHAADMTSIDVAGQLYNRGAYSFVTLAQPIPNLPAGDLPPKLASTWEAFFTVALDPSRIPAPSQIPPYIPPSQWASYILQQAAVFPSNIGFSGNPGFVYDAATGRLGFFGQMSPTIAAQLGRPLTVLRYANGLPIVDSTGHFATDQVSWADASAIQVLYAASQGAATTPQLGYQIGGPGQFNVTAGSISLGNSYGVLSWGVGSKYADLAPVTPSGATINVTSAGDLEMLTSTIAALGGGGVNVTSTGGTIDLGSQELFGQPFRSPGFGVFTSGRGDVNVTAEGDVNVNGSRIAAYNGGGITVQSLMGNVNAGSGGATFVSVPVSYVDPATGKAATYQEAVFGSGILATTLVHPAQVPGSAVEPGNINVATPQGNIYASQGGILQEALNGNVSTGPSITLIAGTRPSEGSAGHAGNIDLGESGVIGGTVNADANGNINGLVVSRQNATINAAQSFSGTVLSGGSANLSAGGSISGTVIGVGGVNASGGQGISAALLGQNVSIGGGQAQSTLGTTAAATATSSSAAGQASTDTRTTVVTGDKKDDEEKKGPLPTLVRRVGRVTVILP